MIRLLQGTVYDKTERTIILFVNGVGFDVAVPYPAEIQENQAITLFIHTHVREDTLALYGFRTKNELNFFEILLTINGIGPKMAMEILNEPIESIKTAILQENIPALTKISGVGKKIAERIILELKSKIKTDGSTELKIKNIKNKGNEEAEIALERLGYKRIHIQKVLGEIGDLPEKAEDIIRLFLQKA